MQHIKIILASASPRRRELLKLLIPHFEIVPSCFDENLAKANDSPEEAVVKAALAKARDVAREHPKAIVIGADTLVVVDEEILGKPTDEDDARRMLALLSGRAHHVYTGVAVVAFRPREFEATGYERTEVRFRELTSDLIDRYVATGEPIDKAGAYAIQGKGCALVEGINGCYFNVVGLPLYRLSRMLEKSGLAIPMTFADQDDGLTAP